MAFLFFRKTKIAEEPRTYKRTAMCESDVRLGAPGENAIYHNNIEAGRWGLHANVAVDLSDQGRGNWWGHDCPEVLFAAGVDSDRIDALDSFPYGQSNAWELGLEPGCDVTPPEAPFIDSPEDGDAFLSSPVVLGMAEPFSIVFVYEGATELGTTIADRDGRFAVELPPLDTGEHSLYATASDRSGNVSSLSSARTFRVFVIGRESPIVGENGKLLVVGLSATPNPFDPTKELNQLRLSLEIDAVKGLGGASLNHRFFALTSRRILDPETAEPLTTVYGMTEIALGNQGTVHATVVDEWDGTDRGAVLENLRAYPSDLSVAVVRLYSGNGVGPNPRLKPGPLGPSLEQVAEIMMAMDPVARSERPKPDVYVDYVPRDLIPPPRPDPNGILHRLIW